MIPQDILSKIHYQTFDELNRSGSSNSSGKFARIKEYFSGKSGSILDIGCNHGYFCFNLHKLNSNLICHGIDIGIGNIQIAKQLNEEIFNQECTTFEATDAFNIPLDKKYNHIICFSTFHYFRDRQQLFLERCYNILEPGGTLVIELAVSKNNTLGHVEKFSRGVDRTPCHFPSQNTFKSWVEELKFNVHNVELSVNQPGCEHNPRYCYILKK